MPPCKSHAALVARAKAQHTHVYISGLQGHHTLEVGLAYYYRGHYLYAFPAGNLIEPVPFSTRTGITIRGILSASAPVYEAGREGLVSEAGVRALEKSVRSERAGVQRWEDGNREAVKEVLDEGVKGDSGAGSSLSRASESIDGFPLSVSSLAGLRPNALHTFTPRHGHAFLAASAPGSRLASRSASPSGLRPVASHIGLALCAIKGPSHRVDVGEFEANPAAEDDSVPLPRATSVPYLFGLGDHALPAGEKMKAGVRVAPCAIHGEECDGVATAEKWLMEETKVRRGFVEDIPQIYGTGRVMVDWARLLVEERAGGGQ